MKIKDLKSKLSTRALTSKLNSRLLKSKRSQEEMVGFVLILIIVAVIIIVFMGISMNKPAKDSAQESLEIERYVLSLKDVSSNCAVGFEPNYRSMGELVRECNDGAKCVDGRYSCDVLRGDLRNITLNAWPLKDRPYKGWRVMIVGLNGNVSVVEGNVTKGNLFSSTPIPPGKNLEFRVYY